MLKQDAVPEPTLSVNPASVSSASVGQARVTPGELSEALAAIEARRQAEAARLAGTIPIEQAVSDLHLDSTPDEIWAEVQALRGKAAAAQEAKQREAEHQQKAEPQKGALPFFQATPAPIVRVQSSKSGQRPQRWQRLLAPVLVIGVLMGTHVIPHSFTPHGFSPSLLTKTSAPILRPFSQVPNGTEVYADDKALLQISEGKPAAQIVVSENASGNRWTVVKMYGHVYLRGFTASAVSVPALDGKALPVYNDDDSGELNDQTTSRIMLRVDGISLQKSGGDGGYSSIIVPNFQHDSATTLTPGN